MKYENFITINLNKISQSDLMSMRYDDLICLALVITESWLRPKRIRVAEYMCMMLGFNLTVGKCQVRSTLWKEFEEKSLFLKIIDMESIAKCILVVKYYFEKTGGMPNNSREVVARFVGESNSHYHELFLLALSKAISLQAKGCKNLVLSSSPSACAVAGGGGAASGENSVSGA